MKKPLAFMTILILVIIILYGCASTNGKNLQKQDTTSSAQDDSSSQIKSSEGQASDKNQQSLEIYDAVDKAIANFLNK